MNFPRAQICLGLFEWQKDEENGSKSQGKLICIHILVRIPIPMYLFLNLILFPV